MHGLLRILFFICVLSLVTRVKAQICNGSLGDAVVNINFGSGNGSNTGYVPTNAYTYTSSSCPNDGFYTITTRTSGCFGNSWITVNNDHTGNGAFLLVNASFLPGDFLVTTVTDLCPNTTYEFAAWLMNVLARSGIKPNITFSIETPGGTVLQQFSTGDIPESFSAAWKQYGFFFTTPVNNPVIVLRMTNNAPGGIGNDIALDDITFRPCGPAVITSSIQGNSDTVDVCEGNTNIYTFNATISSGYVSPLYQWQVSSDSGKVWKDIAGANTITYQRNSTAAGVYWYRLTVIEQSVVNVIACRIASNNVAINVHAKPIVNAGPDRIMIAGNTIIIDGKVTGENPIYYWDPPDYLNDFKIETPSASPVNDITYTLYAASPFGCSNQDAASIKVVKGIFVPNAFTPNNDGKNDRWRIPFLDPLFGAAVNVYNRFGQLVYHAEATTVDWDGNLKGVPQAMGTYVYTITYKEGQKAVKGTFILIR